MGGGLWAEQQSKNTKFDEGYAKMAQIQDKIFEFTMNLWGIDPASRMKWKKVPQQKPDSIICNYDWTELDGFKSWVHYRYSCDSLGMPSLYVDTLFVWRDTI